MKATDQSTEAAAAFWFARLRSDPVGRSDRARFMRWLDEDPGHREAYAEYENFWTAVGAAAADPFIVEMRREALAAAPERSSLRWRSLAAVAAILVIALFTGALLLTSQTGVKGTGTQIAQAEGPRIFRTAVGQRSAVTLEDGSVVELNTDTLVQVAYRDSQRQVRLVRGQAMFEVAHDPARPFVVEAGDQRIVALGTAFDVRLGDGGTQVTLVEGRVRVEPVDSRQAPKANRRILEPGDQLVARPDQPVIVLAVNVPQTVSWRTGRLIFSNEPLGQVVAEINRYSSRQVRLADPALADLRVSGVFRAGSVDRFVTAMEVAFPVAAAQHEDGIVLGWK